jgi:hypothetical protein
MLAIDFEANCEERVRSEQEGDRPYPSHEDGRCHQGVHEALAGEDAPDADHTRKDHHLKLKSQVVNR